MDIKALERQLPKIKKKYCLQEANSCHEHEELNQEDACADQAMFAHSLEAQRSIRQSFKIQLIGLSNGVNSKINLKKIKGSRSPISTTRSSHRKIRI